MRIDYELLKKVSLEDANKKKDVMNDSVVLSSFLKLISNLIFELENLKVNELALITNSINHWVKNKTHSSTKKYKAGTIIEYECGLNYEGELSYRHTGLVLDYQNKFVLVAPTTSGKKYIEKSSEKENGLWYYILVGKKEGFDHDCVLLLNNMKVVSKQRVLSSFGNMCKDDDGKKLFNEIKITLLSHYFQKQYNDYIQTIQNLKSELKQNEDNLNTLTQENEQLKAKLEQLEIENQELREKYRSKKNKVKSMYAKYAK